MNHRQTLTRAATTVRDRIANPLARGRGCPINAVWCACLGDVLTRAAQADQTPPMLGHAVGHALRLERGRAAGQPRLPRAMATMMARVENRLRALEDDLRTQGIDVPAGMWPIRSATDRAIAEARWAKVRANPYRTAMRRAIRVRGLERLRQRLAEAVTDHGTQLDPRTRAELRTMVRTAKPLIRTIDRATAPWGRRPPTLAEHWHRGNDTRQACYDWLYQGGRSFLGDDMGLHPAVDGANHTLRQALRLAEAGFRVAAAEWTDRDGYGTRTHGKAK